MYGARALRLAPQTQDAVSGTKRVASDGYGMHLYRERESVFLIDNRCDLDLSIDLLAMRGA